MIQSNLNKTDSATQSQVQSIPMPELTYTNSADNKSEPDTESDSQADI